MAGCVRNTFDSGALCNDRRPPSTHSLLVDDESTNYVLADAEGSSGMVHEEVDHTVVNTVHNEEVSTQQQQGAEHVPKQMIGNDWKELSDPNFYTSESTDMGTQDNSPSVPEDPVRSVVVPKAAVVPKAVVPKVVHEDDAPKDDGPEEYSPEDMERPVYGSKTVDQVVFFH